jgi:hypothetical protein
VNVCCDFCYPYAFILDVCQLFTDARASMRIQCLRRRFCQPKSFYAHAEMLWGLWFHSRALDRPVWLAFTLLLLVLAMGESHARIPRTRKIVCTPSEASGTFFLATLPSPRPLGGSPRIQNISLESDIFAEGSRRRKHRVRSNRSFHVLKPAQQQLERCKPTCSDFFIVHASDLSLCSFSFQWQLGKQPRSC